MIALNRLIVAVLRTDPTLITLMNITAADPRVYRYYEGAAVIDATNKAYITYARTARPEQTQAVESPIYTLAVWALNMDVAEAVAARVRVLFDYSRRPDDLLYLSTGEAIHPTIIGDHMSAQENTKFAGIQLQVRFGLSTTYTPELRVSVFDAKTLTSGVTAAVA